MSPGIESGRENDQIVQDAVEVDVAPLPKREKETVESRRASTEVALSQLNREFQASLTV